MNMILNLYLLWIMISEQVYEAISDNYQIPFSVTIMDNIH